MWWNGIAFFGQPKVWGVEEKHLRLVAKAIYEPVEEVMLSCWPVSLWFLTTPCPSELE
jgi:hypothetical protein